MFELFTIPFEHGVSRVNEVFLCLLAFMCFAILAFRALDLSRSSCPPIATLIRTILASTYITAAMLALQYAIFQSVTMTTFTIIAVTSLVALSTHTIRSRSSCKATHNSDCSSANKITKG